MTLFLATASEACSALIGRKAFPRAIDFRALNLPRAGRMKRDLYTQQSVIGMKFVTRPIAYLQELCPQEKAVRAVPNIIGNWHLAVLKRCNVVSKFIGVR